MDKSTITRVNQENLIGSSRIGKIFISYQGLKEAFGEPENDECFEVKAQWTFLIKDSIFTIYDYKNPNNVEDIEEWSVGGFKESDIEILKLKGFIVETETETMEKIPKLIF